MRKLNLSLCTAGTETEDLQEQINTIEAENVRLENELTTRATAFNRIVQHEQAAVDLAAHDGAVSPRVSLGQEYGVSTPPYERCAQETESESERAHLLEVRGRFHTNLRTSCCRVICSLSVQMCSPADCRWYVCLQPAVQCPLLH